MSDPGASYHEVFQRAAVPLWRLDLTDVCASIRAMAPWEAAWRRVKVLAVNRAALAMHRATNERALIDGLDRVFSVGSVEPLGGALRALAGGAARVDAEVVLGTLLGRWVRARLAFDRLESALPEGGDQVVMTVTPLAPLAASPNLETQLEESEHRFRVMADSAPVLLWMARTDGDCEFFNKVWLDFTGRPMAKELGAGWAESVYFEDFQSCMHTYLTAFVARRPFRMEYRMRRADGQYRWILDTGVPRYAPDGSFAGYIGSCVDITELKAIHVELDARVRERTTELAGRLAEREVLLREVHHRVKNNLQLVSSLLNMQGRQLGDPRVRDAMEECQVRIQSIALIHERLYQSKDLSRVAFAQYARSLAANIFHATGVSPARVRLDVEIEDVGLGVSRAIPCGLILNELMTNALKHAFPGDRDGVIGVQLRAVGEDRLRLVVSDDGIGLPEDFDVDVTESLGFQLVTTLAAQLDSTLEIDGQGGATFQLTFAAD